VTFSDLDVCKGATLNHQSWELETLDIKAPPQVYMAVKVGNGVIVISSAFANSSEKLAMLSKFQVFANLSR
jgi:hypothetical protein